MFFIAKPLPYPSPGLRPSPSPGVPGVLVSPLALFFCFLALLARSWGLFVCGFVLLFASWARRRPLIPSGVDFGSHFGSKNDHFRLLFAVTFAFALTCFLVLFSVLFFVSFSVFSGRARKTPKTQIRHTFHAKTWFFKVRDRAAAAPRTTTNRSRNH